MDKIVKQILAVGMACALVLGCAGAVTAPKQKVSRYYSLTTVDVKYLPFILSSTSTSVTALERGSIFLNDTLYTRSLTIRETYATSLNRAPLVLTYSESGTFVLGNTTIDFMPISGNGLQLNWNRRVKVFPSLIDYVEDAHNYQFQIQ